MSCLSFKVNTVFPSEIQVECIHLCKKIDDSGDLLEPLDIRSEFTPADEQIICFIKLKDITSRIRLRWKWYAADGKMARDTGDVVVNQRRKYLEAVTAYDMLKLDLENSIEGQWNVAFFINDRLIGRKTFRLNL